MSQAWIVISGKGGVGKSTVTASLGIALGRRQLPTAIVDTDIGLRSLDMLLGLQNRIVYDMVDVGRRDCKLRYALVPYPPAPALSLLPAAQLGNSADMDAESMSRVVHKLKKRFSYVLLDAPAGLERGVANTLASADHALLVTTPDDVAMRDAERVIALLESMRKPKPLLIVNRIVPELVRAGEMYTPQTVANTLDVPLLGYIPEDRGVPRALAIHQPLMDLDCPARLALGRISQRFVGEFVPMPEAARKPGLFRRG